MQFINADCERISVENPVNIISGDYIGKWFPDLKQKYGLPIKPTQTIEPWMFGHRASKFEALIETAAEAAGNGMTYEEAKKMLCDGADKVREVKTRDESKD